MHYAKVVVFSGHGPGRGGNVALYCPKALHSFTIVDCPPQAYNSVFLYNETSAFNFISPSDDSTKHLLHNESSLYLRLVVDKVMYYVRQLVRGFAASLSFLVNSYLFFLSRMLRRSLAPIHPLFGSETTRLISGTSRAQKRESQMRTGIIVTSLQVECNL